MYIEHLNIDKQCHYSVQRRVAPSMHALLVSGEASAAQTAAQCDMVLH